MIHFFTIVLNGMPFIRYHLPMLSSLPIPWHWHVVEGVAELNHDTGWSKSFGGKIEPWMHRNGLSVDGTTDYLNSIRDNRVTIYRKGGNRFWDGKLEMVNAPLENIKTKCLLWEIDSDELWTRDQILDVWDLFQMNPERQAALYRCLFFVGPDLVIANEEVWGNNSHQDWKRTWRFEPGDNWESHEPPKLMRNGCDVCTIAPFSQVETKLHGLVFQHLGYVLEQQVRFKQDYYGYRDAVAQWKKLQANTFFPAKLSEFFSWVKDDAIAVHASSKGIRPLMSW